MFGSTDGRNIKYSANAKFFFAAATRVLPQDQLLTKLC